MDDLKKLLDGIAGISKKLVYIALAVLLLMVLSERVKAEEAVTTTAPAAVTVEAQTDEATGLTKVTVYIRSLIQDVTDKFTSSDEKVSTTAPKAS